jgi:hypothetical protein
MKYLLLGLLCLAVVGSASAAPTNLGPDREIESTGHVLSGGTGVGAILYAPSEADDAAFRAAIAAACGATVDYYDARVGTPDAATLAAYDCVLTWANFAYANNVLFGDNLADFVDAGGSVVLGAFCAYTSGNFLSGRIMTAAYCPVTGGTNHFSFATYVGDGVTCIYAGVASLGATYRDFLTLQGAGIVDGHYTDGEICHAYRPDFAVVYANGCGGFPLDGSGPDWPRAVCNACRCFDGPVPVHKTSWGQIKFQY